MKNISRLFVLYAAVTGLFLALAGAAQGAPVITCQPADRTNLAGDTIYLRVEAKGKGALACQWFFHNAPIPDACDLTLCLPNLVPAFQGRYHVRIMDLADGVMVDSRPAQVRVRTLKPVPAGAAGDWQARQDAYAFYARDRDGVGDIGPAGPGHYVSYLLARDIPFRAGRARSQAVGAGAASSGLPLGPNRASQQRSGREMTLWTDPVDYSGPAVPG